MLARLQMTLDRTDLTERLILSEPRTPSLQSAALQIPTLHSTGLSVEAGYTLVVGYSGSLRSQAALDLTLCLAHQTRLATGKPVTVQVVYVVEEESEPPLYAPTASVSSSVTSSVASVAVPETLGRRNRARMSVLAMPAPRKTVTQEAHDRASQFEQADRILWQARCLADEWRGSLKTHLRFGSVAEQLAQVVEAENASLLILGCESCHLPLIHQIVRQNLPCTILGIPPIADDDSQ
jgi:nucleotide-binding universal stress UspA family protein